jgi:hypothetical protein
VEVAPAQEKREGSWSGGVREGGRERGGQQSEEGRLECRTPRNAVRPGCLLVLQMQMLELPQYDFFTSKCRCSME